MSTVNDSSTSQTLPSRVEYSLQVLGARIFCKSQWKELLSCVESPSRYLCSYFWNGSWDIYRISTLKINWSITNCLWMILTSTCFLTALLLLWCWTGGRSDCGKVGQMFQDCMANNKTELAEAFSARFNQCGKYIKVRRQIHSRLNFNVSDVSSDLYFTSWLLSFMLDVERLLSNSERSSRMWKVSRNAPALRCR